MKRRRTSNTNVSLSKSIKPKMKQDKVMYEKFAGNYVTQPCLSSRKLSRETVIYNKLFSKNKNRRQKKRPLRYYSVSVSTFNKYEDKYDKECERHEREINVAKDRIEKENRRYKNTLKFYIDRLEREYRTHRISRNEFDSSTKREYMRQHVKYIEDDYTEYMTGV